jgi:DNA-binding XRE family transcriptional regulator
MLSNLPNALRNEHIAFHHELAEAIGAGGKTGAIAKEIAESIFKHFSKEEDFAMPQLTLLLPLARGKIDPSMRKMLVLTDKMKLKHSELEHEHKAIMIGLERLTIAAKEENKASVVDFAERLIDHARMEEEIIYPASVLIGEYLKLKLGK